MWVIFMKKIEILSPAGSMESLVAAVMAGCDAVYLGGTFFGARAFANNFDNDNLIKAINYCHLYGVKVYVTTNILIYDNEVQRFLEYVEFLHKNNVDALIIQDLGMLDLVHKTFPNLELHASTQMHVHNLDGVKVAKKLGVKRCVLARETPIEVIKEIKNNVEMDLEIFAHGALCVSYSGECLFSSLIGHRSGNRGSCVGSCRLPYNIVDKDENILNNGEYPLSMKDLNTLEYVGQLIDAGVTSLKIEGRMKSPEYVYTVTKLYRMAVDSYYKDHKVFIDNNELNNLKKIFNREFTKGYLFNEDMKNIINTYRPNHLGIKIGKVIDYKNNFVTIKLFDKVSIKDGIRIVSNEDYGLELNEFYINKKLVKTANKGDIISFKVNKQININSDVLLTKSNELVEQITNTINLKQRKVPVTFNIKIKENNKLFLEVIDDKENKLSIEGPVIEKSINNPTTKEDIINKISKLGDTVYKVENINLDIDNGIFVPMKIFNELRHNLLEELNNKRLYKSNVIKKEYTINVPNYKKETLKNVLLETNNNSNYDNIYTLDNTGIQTLSKVMHDYNNYDINKEYLVSELGALNVFKRFNTNYSFNVTNSYTVALLHSLGANRITLSYEMTPKQVETLINTYEDRYKSHPNLEVVTYGYRCVMTLKTNLNKVYENNNIKLVDRFNNHYKIKEFNNLTYIYDYKLLDEKFNYYEIGVNSIRENREV